MAAAAKADPSSPSFRPHGMLSVVGLGDADLDRIVEAAEAAAAAGGPPGTVCRVANYLFPQVGFR